MGYTTDFSGQFTVQPALKAEHIGYLQAFNQTRRVKRNSKLAAKLPDPIRAATGLPIGKNGAYFVGSTDNFGQTRTPDILDYNAAPADQPGLWCQWTPTDDGTAIVWDDGEKFYSYVQWIEYLIEHFLEPWGYTVNGRVQWSGEDRDDLGQITVADNVVHGTRKARSFIK